jgi:multiple antibiotic resistance protein
MDEIIKNFVMLWSVIDPIGTIPVFIVVTRGFDNAARKKLAIRAVLIAACLLIGFIIGGELLLNGLSIPLSAFQIAGGIILFMFASTMIFGESKPESEIHMLDRQTVDTDVAVFPLAVPSIASPGAMMAVVLLTDKNRFQIADQVIITAVMLIILSIQLLLLLASGWIQKAIGTSGASIVSRIMGMILASVAANSVLAGIKAYFAIGREK